MEFAAGPGAGATLPTSYFAVGSSSFSDLLAATNPDLLPGRRAAVEADAGASGVQVPHGTTIVATTFADGVLIAGDRRATMGNLIAQRDMEKVFVVDDHSAVGIAGSAGIAIEMVRLFAVELQHYEKLEGVPLSLDGKVNQLARMVRGNLGAAMQGFAVVPLFVGYDVDAADPGRAGRIVSFDVAGGHYDENLGYHAAGSGSLFARSSLKKLHDPAHDRAAAVRVAMEALYDAADDDSATGGPDTVRRIYPIVLTITADGAERVADDQASAIAEAVVDGRRARPGGPAGR